MLSLDVVAKEGDEGGLLGLAVSPDYARPQGDLRPLHIPGRPGGPRTGCPGSSRGRTTGSARRGSIIDGLPGGRVHNGGRIKFGPDGRLYVTAGETWHKELAQRLDSLGGKILRLNPDGSIPPDNPFEGSPIWSYGNRNPQGLAWHPETRRLFSSEHGPSGENMWFAHDEINLIERGQNYGWPEVIGYTNDPRYVSPVYQTGDVTWAPSGCAFVTSPRYPQAQGAPARRQPTGREPRRHHPQAPRPTGRSSPSRRLFDGRTREAEGRHAGPRRLHLHLHEQQGRQGEPSPRGRPDSAAQERVAYFRLPSILKSSFTVLRTTWVFVLSMSGMLSSALGNSLRSCLFLNFATAMLSISPVMS